MLRAEDLEDFIIVGERLSEGLQQGIAVGVNVDVGQRDLFMSKQVSEVIPQLGRESHKGVEAGGSRCQIHLPGLCGSYENPRETWFRAYAGSQAEAIECESHAA